MGMEKDLKKIIKGNEIRSRGKGNRSFEETSSSFGFISSKGQMFVIAGIIILIGFFLLRGIFGIYTTIEEKRFQETIIIDKQLKNIYHEYEKIIAVSRLAANPNNTAIANLYGFSSFIRNEENVEIFYVLVYVNNTNYSVTVGNFLDEKINTTVNATTSTPNGYAIGIMDDRTNATRNFVSDISSGVINITVIYEIKGGNVTERFPVRVGMDTEKRSMLQGFFDIKLKSKEDFVRIKETYNATW